MKIEWLGHSAFKLTESTGTTIVTDPFDSQVVGYSMDETGDIDVVTVSNKTEDHNYLAGVGGAPMLINREGAFEVEGVHISSFSSNYNSNKVDNKDKSLIFKFRMDGVDICHLGDVDVDCNIGLSEIVGAVDVLLLPVGGDSTIDAEQAKEYVDLLMPDVVIPMHYKAKGCIMDLDKVDAFTKLFDDEQIIYSDESIEFDRADFEGEDTKVIVFNK